MGYNLEPLEMEVVGDPWDLWDLVYLAIHEWLILMVDGVGKYTMDPLGCGACHDLDLFKTSQFLRIRPW